MARVNGRLRFFCKFHFRRVYKRRGRSHVICLKWRHRSQKLCFYFLTTCNRFAQKILDHFKFHFNFSNWFPERFDLDTFDIAPFSHRWVHIRALIQYDEAIILYFTTYRDATSSHLLFVISTLYKYTKFN